MHCGDMGTIASAVIWGEVADRAGARPCLLFSAALSVLGFLCLGASAYLKTPEV